MKVLFLAQRVPHPPDRGDRITTFHFLRHLREQGHQIRVGCLAEDSRDLASVAELRGLVHEVCAPVIDRRVRKLFSLRGLITGEALTLPFFRVPELQRSVDQWLANDPPELIYVYSSSMAQYVMRFRAALRLMQFAELDSDKWRQFAVTRRGLARVIYDREAERLLQFESAVAREFDVSFVVSEVEKQLFEQRIPDVTAVVLRNGVDVDHFASHDDSRRDAHTLIFTGVMDYEPNVDAMLWFTQEIWPSVHSRFPDAKLLIVGAKPIATMLELHGRHGITVTGRVPDTAPYFETAAVAIAPLRLARGVQNKVLEAMSMSLPVVCTPQAAQGLGAIDEETLWVAGTAEQQVQKICLLLESPERARAIGVRASRFVREHFRWESQFAVLDRVIAERTATRCWPVPGKA